MAELSGPAAAVLDIYEDSLDADHDGDLETQQEAWVLAQRHEDASYDDVFGGSSDRPPGWEELTSDQQAGYAEQVRQAAATAPLIRKIEEAGVAWREIGREATSIRLKANDRFTLMGWFVNLQNIGDLLSDQLQQAEQVIASQNVALDEYQEKTGKALWTPGPVRS